MAKTIKGGKILLQLDDGNTIELFAKKTKKAKTAVDKLNRSEATLNRNFKGASQQSSNATKNFSKMSQGITGGLVPAYATLAANIFAIGAAFRFLQNAADYRILIQGQKEYATVTGESLALLTHRLQEATGQQLAFSEAAQAAAIGRAAGLSSDQISRLGKVAKNASIALGRDLTDSFNRLVRGATKAEPELLDELGIILRLETATQRYGQSIGKTKEELSTFERSQAVTNEVLRQGEEKFQDFATELNAFTKLAKAFDDLINKLKGSLTGVAEFLAGALSKNVVALGGAFALLGTGIARAISPSVPNIDVGKAAGKASEDVGKFYTGKNAAKFASGTASKGDITKLERSLSAKKSTVLNFETFRRTEAMKTVAILKANNIRMEADGKGTYSRMKASFLANLYIMQAEHGRVVGMMKFIGAGLAKSLAFIGYAGMLLSLIGVVQTLMDKLKDPALIKFGEAQERVLKNLEKQNEELEELKDNLKDTAGFFDGLVQSASFLANFSFKGTSDAFMSFNKILELEEKAIEKRKNSGTGGILSTNFMAGVDEIKLDSKKEAGTYTVGLSDTQVSIINNTIGSLQLMQTELDENSASFKDLDKRIELFTGILESAKDGLSQEEYIALGKAIFDLENNTSKAQETFNKFANANRILKDSVVEYGNALAGLRTTSGHLGILMKQVETMEDAFSDILNSDLKDLTAESAKDLMSTAQQSAVEIMIGSDAFAKAIEAADGNDVEALKNIKQALFDRKKELLDAANASFLDQKGIALLSSAAKIGATKLQAKTIDHLEKQRQLEREITASKELQYTFELAGEKADKVAQAQNEQNLLNLQYELELLRLQKDELYLIGQAARNAFEGGMSTALDNLITGKESSLTDAMAKLAQGVFQGISKELSSRVSESISDFLFGNNDLKPYKEGAMIIKQAHIDGITQGMAGNSMSGNSYQTGKNSNEGAMNRLMSIAAGMFGFAKGGITPVYAASGGVYSGSKAGYPAVLHGNEAVVPLPDGKSIPISGGMGGNITVNVSANGAMSSTSDAGDMYEMGRTIAQAVQNEIEKQQRPGGQLSPY